MNSKVIKTIKGKGLTTSTPVAPDATLDPKQGKKTIPAQQNGSTVFGATNTLSQSFEILPPATKLKTNIKKPSTLEMICEAIQVIGKPKKGATYVGIRKWILNNNGNMEPNKLSILLKKALAKGLLTGTLNRPPRSKPVPGIMGYFILAEKNPDKVKPKAAQPKKKLKMGRKKRPAGEAVSDSEMPTSKENHPKRLNVSDSMIEDVRKKDKSAKATKVKAGTSDPKMPKGKKDVTQPKQTLKTTSKAKGAIGVKKAKLNTKPLKTTAPSSKNGEKVKTVVATKLRKDLSDTELDVKPKGRKSLKSYSSDTDIDIVKEKAAKKKANDFPSKTVNAAKVEVSSKKNLKATATKAPAKTIKTTEASKLSKSQKTKKGA